SSRSQQLFELSAVAQAPPAGFHARRRLQLPDCIRVLQQVLFVRLQLRRRKLSGQVAARETWIFLNASFRLHVISPRMPSQAQHEEVRLLQTVGLQQFLESRSSAMQNLVELVGCQSQVATDRILVFL